MCGIAGILLKGKVNFSLTEKIVSMSEAIKHRGPDGEGFLMVSESEATPHSRNNNSAFKEREINYIPKSDISYCSGDHLLAFAHRRLAIIDLSETGHQPMCNTGAKTWITYNGEIYNYIEIRKELQNLGRRFISESDTEVILQAYEEWGTNCVEKFNGMWAFCIYDSEKQICFASRDRLGVKPFYYYNNDSLFSFASEQKAFIKSGLLPASVNQKQLRNYLVDGRLETERENFFEGINELWPGHNLIYDLKSATLNIKAYFQFADIVTLSNDSLSEKELCEKISETLINAVKLRLRSDVEVGACLSGGIDSSALAVIISELHPQPLHCFTSVFSGESINEEKYADLVAGKIQAKHFKTEPGFEHFMKDLDELVYSQDVPIWDPSTYAQHRVMALAAKQGIKVVMDGQGADELFGGYHHHFIAKWNYLLQEKNYSEFFAEIKASKKSIPSPLLFYMKEKLKPNLNLNVKSISGLLKSNFVFAQESKPPIEYFNSVNEQLLHDINEIRLKIFLKCEDRCGMWHGVESRTPFSDDIELLKLMFSFNGNKKIKKGVSKHLLREAVKTKLPREIYTRYDKKGFETPTQKWINLLRPQILSEIKSADFDFLEPGALNRFNANNTAHNKLLFKLFIFARWKKVFNKI